MEEFAYAGTVIHGTMRPQDLIPAFLDCLQELDPAAYAAIDGVPDDSWDDDSWFWESDDAAWLIEELFDALDAAAPEGYYFGAHPGDGADYGFWQIEE